jgi:hypothetical protein
MDLRNRRLLLVRGGTPVWWIIAASGDAVFAPTAEGQVSRLVRLDLCPCRVPGPAVGRRRLRLFRLVVVIGCPRRARGVSDVRSRFLICAFGCRCGLIVGGLWRTGSIEEWFLIHTLGCRCGTYG